MSEQKVTEYQCEYCGYTVKEGQTKCESCGAEFPKLTFICCICKQNAETHLIADKEYCFECFDKELLKIRTTTSSPSTDDSSVFPNSVVTDSITVSTAKLIEFQEDFDLSVEGVFDSFQKTFENEISLSQELLLNHLRYRAANRGLNYVFGITFHHNYLANHKIIISVVGTLARKIN